MQCAVVYRTVNKDTIQITRRDERRRRSVRCLSVKRITRPLSTVKSRRKLKHFGHVSCTMSSRLTRTMPVAAKRSTQTLTGRFTLTGIDRLHLYFRLIVSVTEEARVRRWLIITLRAKLSGAVYCNRSCLWVRLFVCVCGSVTTITRNCVHRSSPNWVCR